MNSGGDGLVEFILKLKDENKSLRGNCKKYSEKIENQRKELVNMNDRWSKFMKKHGYLKEEKEYYRRLAECYKADVQAVEDISAENLSEAKQKIDRLNNILNEIEAVVYADISNIDCRITIQEILDKAKEVKKDEI